MRCLFFFCRPIRGISPGNARLRRVLLGSHLPLGDRRATRAAGHSPGGERANSRQRRDSRVFGCFRAQSARLGSHLPLGDRRAACAARHSPGGERANIRASREIPVCSGAFVRKAHDWVRISRPKIGKRLAQRGIFQAQGEDILAKGEIPAIRFSYLLLHQT